MMANISFTIALSTLLSIGGIIALSCSAPVFATQTISNPEIERLRSQGYPGIEQFLKINGTEMARLRTQTDNPRWQELNKTLDSICKQQDCDASRLYWYTDLDKAKQAAAASNKPILSLRLLGNLDEDLSCANSRFFRITLYSHPEIAKLLRDKYVLHWQSVRPVPKITIDFGDGRKVQQTITGNSIHYILDKTGRPIDALPGLYAPQAFNRHLTQGAEFVAKYHQLAVKDRQSAIDTYHQTQLTNLQANWKQDLAKLGVSLIPIPKSIQSTGNTPSAIVASTVAVTKSGIEVPILQRTNPFSQQYDLLKQATDDPLWVKLGELHQQDAILAENSLQLIRRKQPQLASLTAKDKSTNTDPIPELVTKFQKLIAIDSIRNEYLLHSQIHQWLMGSASTDVESLNTRVYDRLFLTPQSDRWLGLMPGDGYTGIDRDGLIE
jgi:hypothetical protein